MRRPYDSAVASALFVACVVVLIVGVVIMFTANAPVGAVVAVSGVLGAGLVNRRFAERDSG